MRFLLILVFLTSIANLCAQSTDSTMRLAPIKHQKIERGIQQDKRFRFSVRTLAVPVLLITYGVFSQVDGELREFDVSIKNVVRRDPDFRTPVDNYLQYTPGLAVYGLNALGIKGKNNFRDRTMIYLMSNLMMGISVQSIKNITKVQRPEGFGKNAFPSGHTATAFAGAEFLRQEYKEVSCWYGIAGYAVAATTGILRMYNNMHWFRDVVAGAGFGILSTKLAYWLEPIIANKLFRKKIVYHFNSISY